MKKIALSLILGLTLYASTTTMHSAKILETLNSGGYTYMKVQDGKKSYWIAMTQRKVKAGDTISYSEQGWMKNFHSKTLNRTFDNILFAGDSASTKQKLQIKTSKPDVMNSQYATQNSITIANLFKDRSKYANKEILVRGKVTKVSEAIMGLNWIHIQDGSSFKGMNDLVFTSKSAKPKIGEIVTAKGKVILDKDFGYGYFYPVIIQEASFSK
ncbi:GW dipeptide domain-containing protein [Sulfurimonas sp.]